ncbi:P-loop containing nucleoside triphosphate hydrolase protein [Gorgonomyces haynaldii]|nr:P-loop containing nucleoside triphosphate hydrolase protein [Gorgonomyces haynaldii]
MRAVVLDKKDPTCDQDGWYQHQTEALQALESHNIVLTTPTSSGKSRVYQEYIRKQPGCHLLIFPTKALARDQIRSLKEDEVHVFDGDTPQHSRRDIRDTCKLLLTNPDMLHRSILPHHKLWHRFLVGLRTIVIDELHYYKNEFGQHVSLIMKRLQRILKELGNTEYRIIACSATLSNAPQFFESFFGVPGIEISNDGSPKGQRHHLVCNPESAHQMTVDLSRKALSLQIRTLVFCKSRFHCEFVLNHLKDAGDQVFGYRGGYTAQERRRIERDMFEGRILLIVCTNALELGMDIGYIDLVIHNGFPMSVASYRQQQGRAGRRQEKSCSVLVLDHMDDRFKKNPQLLDQEPKISITQKESILIEHLQCMSQELSINKSDCHIFGMEEEEFMEFATYHLLEDPVSKRLLPLQHYKGAPSQHIDIRGKIHDRITVIDRETLNVVEEVESDRAWFSLYPNAILLHQTNKFIVHTLNMDDGVCLVNPIECRYTTRAREKTRYHPKTVQVKDGYHFGPVEAEISVYGYDCIYEDKKRIDKFEMPPKTFTRHIYGVWREYPSTIDQVHTLSHLMKHTIPVYVDFWAKVACADQPRLMIAVGHQRQAEKILDLMPTLYERSKQILDCDCKVGCYDCRFIDNCYYDNQFLVRRDEFEL